MHKTAEPTEKQNNPAPSLDISFIVIGFNEGANLQKCFASVRSAVLEKYSWELIYVDGGSKDDSVAIARRASVDTLLGGEKRRRAAENRNLGLRAANGRFVQFIDGDMVLAPDWPAHAVSFLESHDDTAAVCGEIRETNPSFFYQVLQRDWSAAEGEIAFCGGSAMWRKAVLTDLNGFPESVMYGEEPYLCWRVRNAAGLKIHYLNMQMVSHDLGYRGFGDYWRRNIRCGATYAEIAARCLSTPDKLWLKESISNPLWSVILLAVLAVLVLGPPAAKIAGVLLVLLVLSRKVFQLHRQGNNFRVSIGYAVHVYFSKLPMALGEGLWLLRLFSDKATERRCRAVNTDSSASANTFPETHRQTTRQHKNDAS